MMQQLIYSEKETLSCVESWELARLVRTAILKTFVISDLIHLKVDRRFEVDLHIDSAREMYFGLCHDYGIPWEDTTDEIGASEGVFEYRVQQYNLHVQAFKDGNLSPKVIAFNRRLCTVQRLIENLRTGY